MKGNSVANKMDRMMDAGSVRKLKSASYLARKYKISFYSDNISEIPVSAKIFFITVPDNEIAIVAKNLTSVNSGIVGKLFIHTSGSESSDALKAVKKKGGITASFHIMQTFPSLKKADIRNSFAAIETDYEIAERFLFSLARTLGLKGFSLTKENKVYYHLAGVFAANFLNANLFSSEELLFKTGFGNTEHFRIFEPIITTTLSNIKNSGVNNSLSGPIQRGDYLTIKKHITALKKLKPSEKKLILRSYISQSLILLELIERKEKRITTPQRELKKILEAELKKI